MRIAIWVIGGVLVSAGMGVAQAPPAGVPTIRQGEVSNPVVDVPQRVMFVKSDTTDPKAAIANLLLSDVGIHLLTTGLMPGLASWVAAHAIRGSAMPAEINAARCIQLRRVCLGAQVSRRMCSY